MDTQTTSRFVIAVFDEWDALLAAVEDLSVQGIAPRGAVMFAPDDGPDSAPSPSPGSPPELISFFLAETMELPFLSTKQKVRCTTGALAHELAARSASGARRLASALRTWVSHEHADALQRHVEKGRLVLWFELAQPQDLGVVCGRLIQTSPHVVGMCSMVSRA